MPACTPTQGPQPDVSIAAFASTKISINPSLRACLKTSFDAGHINNLTSLLPQYPKMLTIENFDASNIISAEKAFVANGVWDLREETVLLLDVYDFPKLLNCYQMFYLNYNGYLEFKDKNKILNFDSI